ncbi:iron-sulfur cluster assembly scaffold protein [endosymbiont GvMRE of Glomus versiforme]|uniref:iron-sulfur cluster assembly scaffold protein n=1 Tax=endosymbiont GvMRE of Glomus versiforme TaxID=2039283 RepID=UPI000ED869C8|nr:iron-sulfur cluster assembly scaffold protein [endosymbiont GvMRE of Glomus versiforme]RHZ36409.1 SUF system FeS assembly protein, NifU family [endosymbiont GvMRE of Glomus versiforme]
MSNLSFDKEKKRQIILENFSNPTHEVSLVKLKEISNNLKVPFHTFFSLNTGCGDTIHLLIQQKNNFVELAFFASEQQACCLTVAATNILCHWMENKKMELVKTEIENMEKMLQKQNYQLNNCSQIEVFNDLSQFPQRIECVNLVLRGVKKCLFN